MGYGRIVLTVDKDMMGHLSRACRRVVTGDSRVLLGSSGLVFDVQGREIRSQDKHSNRETVEEGMYV